MKDKNKLAVIDGETLMDMRLVPTKFGNADSILMQSAFIASFAFVPRQSRQRYRAMPIPLQKLKKEKEFYEKRTQDRDP